MTRAYGSLNRNPRAAAEPHMCHPGWWQTKRLRALEYDEWTCSECGNRWVLRYRRSGMTDFTATWEPAE